MNCENVTVIIPAFNEEATIGEVVRGLKAILKGSDVLVVDDGSSDQTRLRAEEAGARVIRHPYNIGNGAAIKTGMRNTNTPLVVFMDADKQHDPADIPALLAELKDHDMVVGARTRDADVSQFRAFGNWALCKLAGYLAGRQIPDVTSGFRAARTERVLEFLSLLPNTFSYPTTLTMSMLKAGYAVKHVPLSRIGRRQAGKSKLSPFRDGMRFIMLILRVIMLFGPLRVFVPASVVITAVGLGLAIFQLISRGGIMGASILTILTGVNIFFFGLLADQVANIRKQAR